MALLAAVDIREDLAQGTNLRHLLVEAAVVILCILAAAVVTFILLKDVIETRRVNSDLQRNLEESKRSAEIWRSEAESLLVGLGVSINSQFDKWKLTPVEKEIALFLLKGLSHKEVAYLRKVSDATVRQQARSVYRKAGVGGRHGLAAFFLEDLALPMESTEASDKRDKS